MKYMTLIYSDPSLEPAYGTAEFETMMQGYGMLNEALKTAGVYVAGDGLQDVETATSVRVRGGKTETMDGPFAETKERLGGYYIIDCADLDEALRFAAMIPSAAYGTVEVRPLADYGL
ncbi:YCII-related domain protein [Asticcacaulis biprosthecium C19]|uniref:YCII-related domain protein n=1 Tax=Asticcacaulis biprosthecium C19 TaxID=715226 RepID=F4QRK3_9CAUL|nr:YciI family protein [Asticcacaulis biprosthecium]EGF90129.1 YCII-related domain protein [Asticcacaulis biprosthecium C19]